MGYVHFLIPKTGNWWRNGGSCFCMFGSQFGSGFLASTIGTFHFRRGESKKCDSHPVVPTPIEKRYIWTSCFSTNPSRLNWGVGPIFRGTGGMTTRRRVTGLGDSLCHVPLLSSPRSLLTGWTPPRRMTLDTGRIVEKTVSYSLSWVSYPSEWSVVQILWLYFLQSSGVPRVFVVTFTGFSLCFGVEWSDNTGASNFK